MRWGRFVVVAGLLAMGLGSVPARGYYVDPAQALYRVGAAQRDITPTTLTNLGGFGLGDGSVLPNAVVGRGHTASPGKDRIQVRALVVDDGTTAVAIADIETQGMFAAYRGGAYGLSDITAQVAAERAGLRADHIIVAADHTHSGPDTIGAWGFVPEAYMATIKAAAVAAIEEAYDRRVDARLDVGRSEALGLVYNQNCTQALNQSPTPDYTGPEACNVPDQQLMDAQVRVLQARAVPDGPVIGTLVSYAAHGTLGGGDGINGDWPQFLSDALAARYGGVGLAMEGAVGRVQPCRPQCAHTRPLEPGLGTGDRKTVYTDALMRHVADGLAHSQQVWGPVNAAQSFIQEPIVSPTVLALFAGGDKIGADLRRSNASPWLTGNVIGTVVSSIGIGNVLVSGFPGEAYPNIALGVNGAVGPADGAVGHLAESIPLGLANDQLGYLIAPTEAYPQVAAEVAVNDNSIFNVSPTIGDHVMCTSIALAARMGYNATVPARCAGYAALGR
jgi:hypothetical protein